MDFRPVAFGLVVKQSHQIYIALSYNVKLMFGKIHIAHNILIKSVHIYEYQRPHFSIFNNM